ncbi:MAG: hypothetical protein IJ217_02560 [Clostridia bacterium]|nr:hypothetical protein [Clostridia bacterium]
MANKKNQYQQNIALVVLSIIIILVVLFVIKTISLLRKPTLTTIVKNGELIKYEEVTGYVIRKEEVVDTSTYSGIINTAISDGYRVAKNGTISAYVSNTEKNLVKKISELDDKIQEVMNSQQTTLPNDVKVLDTSIKANLYNAVKNKEDVYMVSEYKSAINQSIQKKAKIVGELSPSGSKLKELIDERLKYEAELNNSKQVLKAPVAGLVSYRVDGYENILTPNSLSSISIKELEKIKINVGQIIPIDTSKVKIIDNFSCFIAIPMSSEESKDTKLNDKIKLRFDNTGDELIQGTVEYISEEDSQRLIVVEITSNIEELSKYRKINLDVVWWRDAGLKVPDNAIKFTSVTNSETGMVIENIPTVTIQKSSYTETAWVKIIRQANDFSIIENYTDDELLEMGLSEEQVSNRQTIKLYSDVVLE